MLKKIFSSETAWPNGAKLGIDGPWVCPFQNCVRQPHPPFKMAAVTKNRNFFNQNLPNLHNRYKSAERKISQKNPEYMLNYSLPCKNVSGDPDFQSRWPPS
jgi:hypothetical protein